MRVGRASAKALNLTIPDKLLAVADEVITHGKIVQCGIANEMVA